MITSTQLLGSEIYKVKEVWARQKDLKSAHHAIRDLPKGLWFFHIVSPSESQKVMGLKGIHHPNALHCCTGLLFCPWCSKEGQNGGTVINNL